LRLSYLDNTVQKTLITFNALEETFNIVEHYFSVLTKKFSIAIFFFFAGKEKEKMHQQT